MRWTHITWWGYHNVYSSHFIQPYWKLIVIHLIQTWWIQWGEYFVMNLLICCFTSKFFRALWKALIIPWLWWSKLWLTGTFSHAAIQTEAREIKRVRENMVFFILTIIEMVFFLVVLSYTPTTPVQSIGQTCSFFPLVWEYVKDTYWELGVPQCNTATYDADVQMYGYILIQTLSL